MKAPKRWCSIRELIEGTQDLTTWLKWERESLELFHAYAQRFGGKPGSNVFLHVLSHALARQGLTLKQFKLSVKSEAKR